MTRRLVTIVGALLIISALAFLVWTQVRNVRAAQPAYAESDMAEAQRGTLIATVNATGAIEPAQETALSFLANGNVAEVVVKRGDQVRAGQTLARLDTTSLDLQVRQAEANLAAAQATLTKLKNGPTQSASAAAQANLESAQKAYDAVLHPSESSVAAAKANLSSAQAAYNKLLQPDQNEVAIAKADVEKAKAALDQAQAAYDRIGGASNPNIAMTPQSAQLQAATIDYQRAVTAFNAKFNATDAQKQAALAQVQQARDQLARLTATPDSLARAEAQVQQAQNQLAQLTPSAEDIAQAEANVAASRAALDLAKQRVTEAILTAPTAGTITVLDLDPGSFVQAGRPVVTLADLDHLLIKLSIDETDIPRVAIGQPVVLDLDAFPNQTVNGTVSEIAPSATTVQGVVNYQVTIDVQRGDIPVKPGMTANANVQVARKDNVLLIPTRAIRAQGNKRVVTVIANDQPREAVVTLGLSNDQETEILSGLNEGERVLTVALPSNVPGFGPSGGSRSN